MKKADYYKNAISAFITSEKGQRFFNFAYSIGAAIVIWGALFKILHLRGGNTLLCIGMGTEVLMFILTAFDRPPKDYKWERVYPGLDDADEEEAQAGEAPAERGKAAYGKHAAGNAGGGVVVIGNGGAIPATPGIAAACNAASATITTPPPTDAAGATEQYVGRMNSIASELEKLQESTMALNKVSETLLKSFQAITQHSEDIDQSANGYVEQMQSLNHNIKGLNTIYEIQLKSVSSQLDAIDRVNRGIKDIRDMYEKSASQSVRYCEETEKMARYMQQLNSVYEKMITAMTINMYRPMPGAPMPEPETLEGKN
ncbi:MAG: gliding motility protein GldL [Clostridium sp.]|nr:gliding motility protein GldL [Clostridium sp.]